MSFQPKIYLPPPGPEEQQASIVSRCIATDMAAAIIISLEAAWVSAETGRLLPLAIGAIASLTATADILHLSNRNNITGQQ